jgi:hypothetical protein
VPLVAAGGGSGLPALPLVVTESYGTAEIAEPLRIAADPATPVALSTA